MGELAKYFLFGFFLTSIPATTGALIANSQPPQTQVLAENVEVTQPPLASAELSEDGSPSPKVSQTPEPSPPEASPSQAPTPTPDVWPPADLEPLFTRFASEFSADQNMLEYIANCESHYNPLAINGDYVGMFQFGSLTWSQPRPYLTNQCRGIN